MIVGQVAENTLLARHARAQNHFYPKNMKHIFSKRLRNRRI